MGAPVQAMPEAQSGSCRRPERCPTGLARSRLRKMPENELQQRLARLQAAEFLYEKDEVIEETARLHHPARRRGGVAANGARAAAWGRLPVIAPASPSNRAIRPPGVLAAREQHHQLGSAQGPTRWPFGTYWGTGKAVGLLSVCGDAAIVLLFNTPRAERPDFASRHAPAAEPLSASAVSGIAVVPALWDTGGMS
jgi:hypothetical protein